MIDWVHATCRATVAGAFLAAAGGAWAQAPAPAKPDGVAAGRGEVTFARYCAACHGRAGKADGPLATELRTTVPDLTRIAERGGGKFEFEKVARRIDGREAVRGHGSADMPSWGEAFQKTSGTGAASVNEAVAQLVHFIWTKQAPAR